MVPTEPNYIPPEPELHLIKLMRAKQCNVSCLYEFVKDLRRRSEIKGGRDVNEGGLKKRVLESGKFAERLL